VKPKPLILTGLPGCGAAAVAARVATDRGVEAAVVPGSGFDRLSPSLGDVLDRPDSVSAVDPVLLQRREVRDALRSRARVVWLDATDAELAARQAADGSSAASNGDPTGDPASLRHRMLGPLTAVADAIVDVGTHHTTGNHTNSPAESGRSGSPSEGTGGVGTEDRVVEAVVRAWTGEAPPRRRVERVSLDQDRGYDIVVGRGVLDELADHIPERTRRVAVVTQPGIGVEVRSGRDQQVFEVEDGEGAKRLDEVGRLASAFAHWGMTRADCVVAVGGGVVTDLGGFVASAYHRGIPVIHVSTTLLGQIDAAIGGKCGVNLPEGKNLVGAFWQPRAVLCDVNTLDSLPAREFGAGMGELAKYHFLGGGALDRLELVERVARSAGIKAEVVSGDEREGGRRAILNYGHTLAHAMETLGNYELRHGEAVAIGLIHAAELAHLLGRIDADRVAEHRRVVAAYGLSGRIPPGYDHDKLIDLYSRDKKALDGITFVLDGPNGVEPVRVDDRHVLRAALAATNQ
jgi:5-deoxy-5-amino-3-dehydroquinate synthase